MSIHIEFADGSNPWVKFNMSVIDYAKEILRWAKRYDLAFKKTDGSISYFIATEHSTTDIA